MKFIRLILLSSLISIKAFAGLILTNQYSIETIVNHLGGNQYEFLYNVTNNNQQSINPNYAMTGLDGFYVMVPDNAILSSFVTPLPYNGSPGFWTPNTSTQLSVFDTGNILPVGYQWVYWWGGNVQSVYPINTTASFGFTIDNINLGTVTSVPVTFWWLDSSHPSVRSSNASYYSAYVTEVQGATRISVPEPSTQLILLSSLLLLFFTKIRPLQKVNNKQI